MTNTPNSGTVSVSRELLERALSCASSSNTSNWSSRLCEDLLALLAQPADQQGEPVAWTYMHRGRESYSEPHPCLVWASESIDVMRQGLKTGDHVHFHPRPDLYDWRPLFYAQPATAKVVLPERETVDDGEEYLQSDWVSGFNACLDATAKLNGELKVVLP